MYVARFDGPDQRFAAVAIAWDGRTGSGLGGWAGTLARHPEVDVALRLYPRRPGTHPTVLLSTDARHPDVLRRCLADLEAALGPQSLTVAGDAVAFDALLPPPPPHQVRVQYRGFHHGGIDVACDFRLYASLGVIDSRDGAVYQVNWAAHRPDAECERQVRKHLARLDLEPGFSDAARKSQAELAQRLLRPGWIGDEYLAFADGDALGRWQQAVHLQFAQGAGHAGFVEPPLEPGDFQDWFTTGCPTLRDRSEPDSLMRRATACFDAAELDWLMRAGRAGGVDDAAASIATSSGGQVFISYASPDFDVAMALCRLLEGAGQPCWIAPRDIERTLLPYTEAISKAIASASAVAVLLSETANRSVHIPREIDLALAHSRPVVPIRIEPVLPAGQLDYLLRTCQWLDAFDRDMNPASARLMQRLAAGRT